MRVAATSRIRPAVAVSMAGGIVGVGGAHVDRIGHVAGPFRPGASNPGTMTERVGGCMANTLRVAGALTDTPVGLISARGGDMAGRAVAEALEQAGIGDHSAVYLDRSTPTYTAIMDEAGEVRAALADMNLYETGLARHLRRAEPRAMIAGAALVVVDANLPSAAIGAVLDAATSPVIALAVSPAKAGRLVPHAGRFALTFMNRRECHALIGNDTDAPIDPAALARLGAPGFARAVISDGDRPVTVLDGEAAFRQPVAPIATAVDVTGAGDALAGAVIARWPAMALGEAVRLGVAAAAATIAVRDPFRADIAGCDLAAMAAALPRPTPCDPEPAPTGDDHAADPP